MQRILDKLTHVWHDSVGIDASAVHARFKLQWWCSSAPMSGWALKLKLSTDAGILESWFIQAHYFEMFWTLRKSCQWTVAHPKELRSVLCSESDNRQQSTLSGESTSQGAQKHALIGRTLAVVQLYWNVENVSQLENLQDVSHRLLRMHNIICCIWFLLLHLSQHALTTGISDFWMCSTRYRLTKWVYCTSANWVLTHHVITQ